MFSKEGIEGLAAPRTAIYLAKPDESLITYRGYSVTDLVREATFEETVYLLWLGDLPTAEELEVFESRLRSRRALTAFVMDLIRGPLLKIDSMEVLRTVGSLLAGGEPGAHDISPVAIERQAIGMLAAMPALAAAHQRLAAGLDAIPPDPELGHAANLAYMNTGRRPDKLVADAIDMAMTLSAEDGFDASVFAARVTAGTLASLDSAVASAIGAFQGRLHGGQSAHVMEMLRTIGDPSQVKNFVDRIAKSHGTIPGFSRHARLPLDPRTILLKTMADSLGAISETSMPLGVARELEETVRNFKGLSPRPSLYLGPILELLGVPAERLTATLACARLAGWIAHIMEQYADNRLMRPPEEYIGPLPRLFLAIEERG